MNQGKWNRLWLLGLGIIIAIVIGVGQVFESRAGQSDWMVMLESEQDQDSLLPAEEFPATSEQMSLLYVDIKGAVKYPGVYSLEPGSRMVDLIQAAGGLLDEASDIYLNQAQLLEDQMMVYVYSQEEIAQASGQLDLSAMPVNPPNMLLMNPQQDSASNLVNINSADLTQLQTLPGIGPKKAQAIIDYRQDQGSFQAVEDLLKVSGIGPATFSQLEGLVSVR